MGTLRLSLDRRRRPAALPVSSMIAAHAALDLLPHADYRTAHTNTGGPRSCPPSAGCSGPARGSGVAPRPCRRHHHAALTDAASVRPACRARLAAAVHGLPDADASRDELPAPLLVQPRHPRARLPAAARAVPPAPDTSTAPACMTTTEAWRPEGEWRERGERRGLRSERWHGNHHVSGACAWKELLSALARSIEMRFFFPPRRTKG
jgi:hypothetical protein